MKKQRPMEVPGVSEPGSGPAGLGGRGLSLTFMLCPLFFSSLYSRDREPFFCQEPLDIYKIIHLIKIYVAIKKKLLDLLNFKSHLRLLWRARPNDFEGLIWPAG